MNLPILYEDDDCMVINKPAGVPVHPGSGADDRETILDGVSKLFSLQSRTFSEDSVLVHRLDKDTTGCLLIAKNPTAHKVLQKQFEERTVSKSYLAIVAGVPKQSKAIIDAPVGRNLTDRKKMSVLRTSVSREAQTTYTVLDSTETVALLQCKPHTGRTHQIRVHLSSIGHPILGDSTYESPFSKKLSAELSVQQIALHAWNLSFESPIVGAQSVTAFIPKSFGAVLQSIGLQVPVLP